MPTYTFRRDIKTFYDVYTCTTPTEDEAKRLIEAHPSLYHEGSYIDDMPSDELELMETN